MMRDRSSGSRAGFPGERSRYVLLADGRDLGAGIPIADLAARAQEAGELSEELMGMGRAERVKAARQEKRFHRAALLTLLNLEAESALLQPRGRDVGEQEAEVATILAACLVHEPRGDAVPPGALAHWLLGKARLERADLEGAVRSFQGMLAFAGDPVVTSEAKALAAAGWAQVDQAMGAWDEAVAHFRLAGSAFAGIGATLAAAACLAEIGFTLLTTKDLLLGRRNLQRAWRLLDTELAPTMAARVALGCAEIEAQLGEGAERQWLARAQGLYGLRTQPCEDLARAWTEGRIAAAAGRHGEALVLLERAQAGLVVQGSLGEAVRVSCDQLSLRLAAGQPLQADAIADALGSAFPDAGAAWARAMLDLADIAAAQGRDAYQIAVDVLLERLPAHEPLPGRPDALTPRRALTDRLLRHRGEFEDPLGGAES